MLVYLHVYVYVRMITCMNVPMFSVIDMNFSLCFFRSRTVVDSSSRGLSRSHLLAIFLRF